MDAKITKKRLSRMLSYDWLKMVISAAALILLWLLIFTMTATAITPSQQFSVINYVGNVAFADGDFYDVNQAAFDNGIFSFEIMEMTTLDLSTNVNDAGSLLQARATLEEGDVLFIADADDYRSAQRREYIDETTGEVNYEYRFERSYIQTFLQGYFYRVYDINTYLDEMRTFVGQYYEDGDYQSPSTLNKQKIKNDFNARTKKDKRFKKSAARAQGEKDEIVRIEKYRDALVKFEWYLENNVVALTETIVHEEYFKDGSDLKGTYSINLCPTIEQGGMTIDGKPAMSALINAVAYKPVVETVDENGKNTLDFGEATAENMNVCLFDFASVGCGFQYESLSYVVYLIEEYVHKDMLCPEYVYA